MDFEKLKARHILLTLLTVSSFVLIFAFAPIGQNPSFHNFVDQRSFLGVPNFFNVITNLPFVIVGMVGLSGVRRRKIRDAYSATRLILFSSVIAIGLGSAWYHYCPGNASLVWDRIPMTLTFMSYFSFIIGSYVNRKLGSAMLIPMLLLGVFSVCYWYITERNGNGDLRLYAWVQFYPMLCIPLIVFLYPTPKRMKLNIVSVIVVYAMAKIAEHADESIYSFHHVISGHSLKHLVASFSVLLILLSTLPRQHNDGAQIREA